MRFLSEYPFGFPQRMRGRFQYREYSKCGDMIFPVTADNNKIESSEVKYPEMSFNQGYEFMPKTCYPQSPFWKGWRKGLFGSCLN
jgi:hypothetical protein